MQCFLFKRQPTSRVTLHAPSGPSGSNSVAYLSPSLPAFVPAHLSGCCGRCSRAICPTFLSLYGRHPGTSDVRHQDKSIYTSYLPCKQGYTYSSIQGSVVVLIVARHEVLRKARLARILNSFVVHVHARMLHIYCPRQIQLPIPLWR